jgi:lipoprotein-anchoring transpeptidase ErfK/SrfK
VKVNYIFSVFLAAVMVLSAACGKKNDSNRLDNLNPKDPSVEKELKEMDKEYEDATGKSSHIAVGSGTCYQIACPVFALVDKENQEMNLYVNGELIDQWPVSSGKEGLDTPNFDKRPNGRIYDEYNSKKFPGGDYNGMGNMPYAVFISGGYAIHGTGKGSWKRLGTKASHGCIRIHPDNAKKFNELVRAYGVANTWITVQ